jgi:hypothetical protein
VPGNCDWCQHQTLLLNPARNSCEPAWLSQLTLLLGGMILFLNCCRFDHLQSPAQNNVCLLSTVIPRARCYDIICSLDNTAVRPNSKIRTERHIRMSTYNFFKPSPAQGVISEGTVSSLGQHAVVMSAAWVLLGVALQD